MIYAPLVFGLSLFMPCAVCGRSSGSLDQPCVGCRTLSRVKALWDKLPESQEAKGVSALRECVGLLTDLVEVGGASGSGVLAPEVRPLPGGGPEPRQRREEPRSPGRERRRRRDRGSGGEDTPRSRRRRRGDHAEEKPLTAEEKGPPPRAVKEEAVSGEYFSEEAEESEEVIEEEVPEVLPEKTVVPGSLNLKATGKASASKPKSEPEGGRDQVERGQRDKREGSLAHRGGSDRGRDAGHRREGGKEAKEGRSPKREASRPSRPLRPEPPIGPPPRHHGGRRCDRSRSRKPKSKGKTKRERGQEWRRQQNWSNQRWPRR